MPRFQRREHLATELYAKNVFEEMGYKVWWYNQTEWDTNGKRRDTEPKSRADMAVLDQYPGTPRKLKRPHIPVEVKRRDMDWATDYPEGIVLDVDKVLAMRLWSDNQKRVIDNHRIKLADPSGRYSGLANEPPKGPAMFIVVPNDLTLRKVWIGHDRIGEWKVTSFARTKGERGDAEKQVFLIPKDHFTVWHAPEELKELVA